MNGVGNFQIPHLGKFGFPLTVARFDIRAYYESINHCVMLAQLNQAGVSRDVFAVVQNYLCVPDKQKVGSV